MSRASSNRCRKVNVIRTRNPTASQCFQRLVTLVVRVPGDCTSDYTSEHFSGFGKDGRLCPGVNYSTPSCCNQNVLTDDFDCTTRKPIHLPFRSLSLSHSPAASNTDDTESFKASCDDAGSQPMCCTLADVNIGVLCQDAV